MRLHLAEDIMRPRHTVWLTDGELRLVNLIRGDKGIGPVLVLDTKELPSNEQKMSEPDKM